MSMTHTAMAGGVIILTLVGVSKAIIPNAPPIQVHEIRLDVDSWTVTQDRTVTGPNDVLLMTWAAQIVDAETGAAIRGCTGSGSWPYSVGRLQAEFSVEEWPGGAHCGRDAVSGPVILRAVYSWGDGQVVAESGKVMVE
jgi:hypothetical protein